MAIFDDGVPSIGACCCSDANGSVLGSTGSILPKGPTYVRELGDVR